MPGEPPAIPGYAFDHAKNRYFKVTKTGHATKSSSPYSIAGQARDARDKQRIRLDPKNALQPLDRSSIRDVFMGFGNADPQTMQSQHQAGLLGNWRELPSPAKSSLGAISATQDYFVAGCAYSGAVYLFKDTSRGGESELIPLQLLAPAENYIYNSPAVCAHYTANKVAVARASGYKSIKLYAGSTSGTLQLEELAEVKCDLPLLCHASRSELGLASSKTVTLYAAPGGSDFGIEAIWRSKSGNYSTYSCMAAAGQLISGSSGLLLGRRDGTVCMADKRDPSLVFVRAASMKRQQQLCVTNVASASMNQYTIVVSQVGQPGPALYDLRRGPESAPVLQYNAANHDQMPIGLTLSPGGAALATSDDQGSVLLFDTATGKQLTRPSEPWLGQKGNDESSRAATSLAWGRQLAASYAGKLFVTSKP